jgi:hypothetical protein
MTDQTGAPSAAEPMDAEESFLSMMSDVDAALPAEAPKKQNDAPADDSEEAADENQLEESEDEESEDDDAEGKDDKESDKESDDPKRATDTETKEGQLRYQDYTQKTMELAEEKRQVAEKAKSMDSERLQYANNLQFLTAQLEKNIAEETKAVDWEWLKENDPGTYALKKLEVQERREVLQKAQAEQQWVNQAIAKYESDRLASYEAEQQKLLAQKIPDFADPKRSSVVAKNMVEFLNKEGFSNEEISKLKDHRLAILANKAMKYDNLQAGKTLEDAKIKDAPKFTRPTEGRKTQGAEKQIADARRELKRSGSEDAAISVFKFL